MVHLIKHTKKGGFLLNTLFVSAAILLTVIAGLLTSDSGYLRCLQTD